ncbi:MAG: MBOAT family protein [Bacteroidetes bacterium]|nr:MBOAT family protein [Bacteroidota bacterium]
MIDFKALLQQFLYNENDPLLFNNGFFIFYFAIFISCYYYCRNNYKVRTWLFCLFSLYFFYKSAGVYVLLVVASAVADYFIGNLIYEVPSKRSKKILLWVGLCFNIGLLVYFKYFNFLLNTYYDIVGLKTQPLKVVTLVGISFYTFESISYMVDVYHRKILPASRFADYLLFLSFFPKLVMGPIVRASDFLPQISKPYYVSNDDFAKGFYLIISGLFKKLIISDFIYSNFVSYVFDEPQRFTGLECLFAAYGFAVVIYCDFSGYTNIAIGLAKWLGFDIPDNFNLPYTSTNITDFWKRWHISLSSWLKDYLYIPLGGNRKGVVRKYLNLIITMLIGGLWHGASFTFIIWGLMHGCALAIHKLWVQKSSAVLHKFKQSRLYNFFAWFVTFQFVCIAWIFFKAKDMATAKIIFSQIKKQFGANTFVAFWQHYYLVILMILLGLLIQFIPKKVIDKSMFQLKQEGLLGYMFIFFIFIFLYAFLKVDIQPIYLQF